ncbi:hypothetical protein B0H10DRAFT_1950422 [Mycena sp. CBHHK59/15]|nr:hypothetical protein B0H10DRAFT_1950422 [Mycena sp. CBHHK59/15]
MPLETPFILKLTIILLMIWLTLKTLKHLQLTSSFELTFSKVLLTTQPIYISPTDVIFCEAAVYAHKETPIDNYLLKEALFEIHEIISQFTKDHKQFIPPKQAMHDINTTLDYVAIMRSACKEAQTQAKAAWAAAKDAKPSAETKAKGTQSKAKALPKSPLIVPDSDNDKSDDDKSVSNPTHVDSPDTDKLGPFKMDVNSNVLMFGLVPSELKFHKNTGIVKVEETPVKIPPVPVIHPKSAVAILERTAPNDLPIKCPCSGSFYDFDHDKEYQADNLSSIKGHILEDVSKDIIEHGAAMVEVEAQKSRNKYHAKQSAKGASLPLDCPSTSKIAMTLLGNKITYY